MSIFSKDQWKTLLSLPPPALSKEVNGCITKHGPVIRKWLEGETIQCKSDHSYRWVEVTSDQCTFSMKCSFRVKTPIIVELEFEEDECNRILYLLENTDFPRKDDRDLRRKLMKAIETKLEQHSK